MNDGVVLQAARQAIAELEQDILNLQSLNQKQNLFYMQTIERDRKKVKLQEKMLASLSTAMEKLLGIKNAKFLDRLSKYPHVLSRENASDLSSAFRECESAMAYCGFKPATVFEEVETEWSSGGLFTLTEGERAAFDKLSIFEKSDRTGMIEGLEDTAGYRMVGLGYSDKRSQWEKSLQGK
jgi:hypothetical protein